MDLQLAAQMAISSIAAYHPESRADFVNIARTLAFSMAAVSLLGQTFSEPMPLAEKKRIFTLANTLNRSADQSERTMMQRREAQRAHPPAPLPAWMNPKPEPAAPDLPGDAEIEASMADAIRNARAKPAPAPNAPVQDPPVQAAPAEVTPAASTETAPASATPAPPPSHRAQYPQPTAINHRPGSSRIPTPKQALFLNSALQRVVQQNGAGHSA